MGWRPVQISEEENRGFDKRNAKKCRFLVDESLGFGITKFLRNKGWNVKDVSELGLSGHSDKDIYSAAYRENRILLTHDRDFLDNRRFPLYANPGVIVLPGGDGNEKVLLDCLIKMLRTIGPYQKVWAKTKVAFSKDKGVQVMWPALRPRLTTPPPSSPRTS